MTLYVGKYYLERSKQIMMDRLGKTGFDLRLYTGDFPTKTQVDSVTLTRTARVPFQSYADWGEFTGYDAFNEGLQSLPEYSGSLIASTTLGYNDVRIDGNSIIYSFQTMRSLTAAVDGPINFFEIVSQNKRFIGWLTGQQASNYSSYRTCGQVGMDHVSTFNSYGSVYGLVGEVGTNNNLTVSKQNVLTGEQFYIHDLYFKFEIDVDTIKSENPTLL